MPEANPLNSHGRENTLKCDVCDLPAGHEGPHEATFPFIDASPGWTGSPEQWAVWRAHVAAGTAVRVVAVDTPRSG